ncbi:hypothetical protein OROHE_001357 [Orobanche hederae]
MDNGKRDWWNSPKWSDDYENGVDGYLDRTFATEAQGDQICCPCSKCLYRYWYHRNEVRDHIICKGFVPRLEKHMESGTNIETPANDNDKQFQFCDDMNGLLHDTFRAGANEETRKFYKLIEEGQEELYPGCKTFSKLAFTIRLFLFKCDHKLSNVAFSALLELLRSLIPDAKLPSSFREASNDLKMLGLDYIKIDACPNNCMLYWENHIEDTSCHVCNTSRWKSESRTAKKKSRKIPAKVLRYFPLKKRLQRIYMCSETARYMTWHEHERKKDGILRHPADGIDWQDFNKSFPSFAQEPRNVRLGLATDGFNPFNNVKILHSTWPVLLINYNLPPSMYMKSDFIMLSLIIPGPESPKNAIDVYMQPLVKELKELWESGIDTYDASSNQMFNMRAALHSTISDFPGYAMLSGWSTKGKTACPCCHYETQSTWLKFSKKTCYRDYRIFLEHDHPWRFNTKKFNGKKEERSAPVRLMDLARFWIYMGKRAILESDKAPKITKYEEERLKRLAFNRERMQAAGFTTCLANKAILNNTINLQQKNVEQDSSWSDHELEPNKQHECDEDSILIPKGSHCVKGLNRGKISENNGIKLGATQSSTMGEFVKLRSTVKEATLVQQNKVTELPEKNLQKASTCQVPAGDGKKKLGMQKKPQKVLPGSVALYLQLRKKQQLEKNNIYEKEKFCNEEQFDQIAIDKDFEQEQENGVFTHSRPALLEIRETDRNSKDHRTDESVAIEGETQQNRDLSTIKKASLIKKTRGPTVLADVHNRKYEDRPPIVLNEYGQPIGPTKEASRELSRFLGTVAKDSMLAPLNYCEWSKFPSKLKAKIWDYVLEKYMIPEEGFDWVMTTVNTLWRTHKSRVKKQYYYAFDNDDDRWKNRPETMSDQQFLDLLQYWNMEDIEKV